MTKNIYLNLIIASIFSISVNAQTSNLETLDVFKLQHVSNPQISPDGNSILYERNFKDIMTDSNYSNIWIVNYDGSNSRPITTGNNKHSEPTWSKTEKFLLRIELIREQNCICMNLKKITTNVNICTN